MTRRLAIPAPYAVVAVLFGLVLALVLAVLRTVGVSPVRVGAVGAVVLAWSVIVVTAGVRVERGRFARTIDEQTAALAESERHFRILAECSGDVVVRHDPDGTLAWVSPMVTDILGWRPDELVGKVMADLVHPDDAAFLRERERGLRTGDRMIVVDVRVAAADGQWRWIQASMTLTGRAGASLGVSVWRDVEDQVMARQQLVRAEHERRIAEERLRSSLDVVPIGFARYGVRRSADGTPDDFVLEYLNQHARAQTHHESATLPGASLEAYFPEARATLLWPVLASALEDSRPRTYRYERPDADATVWDTVVGALDEDTVVVAWQDVTELVARERLLATAYEETAEARVLLHLALEAVAEPFSVWDVTGDTPDGTRLMVANPATTGPLGLSPDEATGRALAELYDAEQAHGFQALFRAAIAAGTAIQGPDFSQPGLPADRATLWRPVLSPMGDNRVALVLHDVTAEIRAAQRLQTERDDATRAARQDALTGLANRRGLEESLAAVLKTEPDPAVVFVDLDRFKQVNDTHGHEAGDRLLVEVAARLRSLVRHEDVVARLGGDEFVLVLTDLAPDWDERPFLTRARRILTAPLELAPDVVVEPGASFGVVRARPGQSAEQLLKDADASMYDEKRRAHAERLRL